MIYLNQGNTRRNFESDEMITKCQIYLNAMSAAQEVQSMSYVTSLLGQIISYLIKYTNILGLYLCNYIFIHYVIEKLHFNKILNI